jgi:exo-beta-1,3-glucanase (GH17 family)
VPVSTAEPWHVWLNYPELAKEVDYLAVHVLPYWDEQSSEAPLDYLKDKIGQLRKAYPEQEHHRHRGRLAVERRRAAQPGDRPGQARTPAEQARNIRDMVAWLKAQNIQYFVVEAIDQPWKSYDLEGKAGGYWGLWEADRQQKFDWTGPDREPSRNGGSSRLVAGRGCCR